MTLDAQISTTGIEAFKDLRDKVGGMSEWGVVDDSIESNAYLVLSTPEDVQVGLSDAYIASSDNGQFHSEDYDGPADAGAIQEGMNWDPANTSWGTSGARARAHSDGDTYERNHSVANNWGPDDDVEYWLHYSSDGFYYYVRRIQADGNDQSYGIGYQLWETEYWDFHSANQSSGYAAQGSLGAVGNDNYWQSRARELERSYGGEGLINPDANFNNYVYDDEIFHYSKATNSETNSSVKAATTPGLWKQDLSGTSLNAGDVVQGSGGTNEYMILDYHNSRVAISMK